MAIVQPYFAPVPISAEALAADPSLANYNCWDLRVAVAGVASERFTVATMYSPLAPGTFYSPVGGGDIPVAPVTENIAYDTYVTIPGYQPGMDPSFIGIPGKADVPGSGPGPADFPRAGAQQSLLSATWGSLGLISGSGDFEIARLTVSKDAVGSASGRVMSNASFTMQYPFDLSFTGGMLAANSGSFGLLADATRDNRVNSADFNALSQHFNQGNSSWGNGDFNGDGVTNMLDFNAIANHYGVNTQAPALGTLVPEPLSGVLIGAVGMMLVRRRANA